MEFVQKVTQAIHLMLIRIAMVIVLVRQTMIHVVYVLVVTAVMRLIVI